MPSILCTKPLELVMLVDNSGSGAMNLIPEITQPRVSGVLISSKFECIYCSL